MTQQMVRPPSGPSPEQPTRGAGTLALPALIALVVGSMIGSGIFALPSQMARSAAPRPRRVGLRGERDHEERGGEHGRSLSSGPPACPWSAPMAS